MTIGIFVNNNGVFSWYFTKKMIYSQTADFWDDLDGHVP